MGKLNLQKLFNHKYILTFNNCQGDYTFFGWTIKVLSRWSMYATSFLHSLLRMRWQNMQKMIRESAWTDLTTLYLHSSCDPHLLSQKWVKIYGTITHRWVAINRAMTSKWVTKIVLHCSRMQVLWCNHKHCTWYEGVVFFVFFCAFQTLVQSGAGGARDWVTDLKSPKNSCICNAFTLSSNEQDNWLGNHLVKLFYKHSIWVPCLFSIHVVCDIYNYAHTVIAGMTLACPS